MITRGGALPKAVALAILIVGLGAVGLFRPPSALAAASGCVLQDDTSPSPWGCGYSEDSLCYECEYTDSGGTRTCYESTDGRYAFCVLNQDT